MVGFLQQPQIHEYVEVEGVIDSSEVNVEIGAVVDVASDEKRRPLCCALRDGGLGKTSEQTGPARFKGRPREQHPHPF